MKCEIQALTASTKQKLHNNADAAATAAAGGVQNVSPVTLFLLLSLA